MCLHRNDNLTLRRPSHVSATQRNGVSTTSVAPAISSQQRGGTDNDNTPDGGAQASPSRRPNIVLRVLDGFVMQGFLFVTLCFGLLLMARQWFTLKRVCAWCKTRMGGNPLSRNITHGICKCCYEGQKQQMAALNGARTVTAIGVLLAVVMLGFNASAAPIRQQDAVTAIVGEAANQGRDGMLAVAGAIRNRGTLRGVYGLKNPSAAKQPARIRQQAALAWAMSATNDITCGATHWENTRAFGTPAWAKSMTITTNIGAHTFYR